MVRKMSEKALKKQDILTGKDVALYVAERLKITRRQNHISLQDLSQKLGITRKQLQNYESGKSNISIIRLWEIASLLNTDITFFVEGLSNNKNFVSNTDLRFIYKLHHLRSKSAAKALIGLLNNL